MAEDLSRFAGLLREKAPAIIERIFAAEDWPFPADGPVEMRDAWKDILVRTMERIAGYFENGPPPTPEHLLQMISRMRESDIDLKAALDGKLVIEQEVVGALVETDGTTTSGTLELMRAVQHVLAAVVGTYLSHAEGIFRSEQQDLLDSIGEMGVVVFRADMESRLLSLNQAGAALLGAEDPGQLIGRRFAEFYADPQDREKLRAALAEEGQVTGYRLLVRRLDGGLLWTEFNMRTTRDAEGRPAGFEGFARDIDELVRSEEERRLIEQMLEELPIGIFKVDEKGIIAAMNPGGVRVLGAKDTSEMVGKPVSSFYADPADREKMLAELNKRGQLSAWPLRVKHMDGHVFWADLFLRAVRDSEGKLVGTEGFLRDITEQRQAEQALRESEEKYRTLFQTAAEGILVADVETKKFNYANPAICQMLGYTEEELSHLGVSDVHPPESLKHVVSEFEAQARGEKTLAPSIPCLRKDGTVIYADISTVNVLIGGRQCNVGFFADTTELAEVRQQLDTERHRLEHVVSSLGAGLSLLDRDLEIVWINEPLAVWFGPLEEIRGRKCYEVYHGKDQPCPDCPAIRSLETGEPCVADVPTQLADGEHIFRLTTTAIRDESGEIIQVLELTQDITAERNAEAERQRAAELLAGVLRSAGEYAIVGTDNQGIINYFSEGAQLLFGMKSEATVGQAHVTELWLPEGRKRLVVDLEELGRGGRYEEDTELLRTQGLTFNARVSGSARRDADGGLAGYTFVIRDVTEERAAQKLVTLLAHALESSHEGVCLTDMSGVITYVNPMMTVLTGYLPGEILGKDFSIFYPDDVSGEEVRAIARATLAGGWSGEVENIHKDGTRYPTHLTTSLVRDDRGRAVAMVGLARDITREKSLQKRLFEQEQRHLSELERQVRERTAELERAYRDLQKLDAMKDRFLTNISHELRTPLVSGVGYIELILQEGLGPINAEIRKGLRVAHRNLLRLVNLIDDLLAFTRLEAGRDAMVLSRFDLEQMITDCLLDLKVRANKQDLKVDMHVEKDLPLVQGDEENIHRVFTNLLSNAEKFTGEKARISVRAKRAPDGEFAEVRIVDDGVGIPEDERPHVFDRFYRSRRTQSTRYGGTGIGLSLVKEILESHNCTVRAENPEKQGTVIVFTLPLAKGEAEPSSAPSTPRPPGERRAATILVVDDDPEVHELLETVFAASGDHLLTASGGEEGLRLAMKEDLDLIFLDISMDDMQGVEVLKRLRADEKTRHIPVYMLTARADDRAAADSRKAGANGFITKPFALADVREVVEDVLAGSTPES